MFLTACAAQELRVADTLAALMGEHRASFHMLVRLVTFHPASDWLNSV